MVLQQPVLSTEMAVAKRAIADYPLCAVGAIFERTGLLLGRTTS